VSAHHRFRQSLAIIADLCAITSGAFLAIALRFPTVPATPRMTIAEHSGIAILDAVLIVLFCHTQRLYSADQPLSFPSEFSAIVKSVLLATLLLGGSLFLTGVKSTSRLVVALTAISALLTMTAWRQYRRYNLKKAVADGLTFHNVLIIGTDHLAQTVAHHLAHHRQLGFLVVGHLAVGAKSGTGSEYPHPQPAESQTIPSGGFSVPVPDFAALPTETHLAPERNPHPLSTEHLLHPERNPHPLFTEHPLSPERNPHPLFTEHPLHPERNPHSLSTEHPLHPERNPHPLSTEHPLQPERNPHPLSTEHPLHPERNPHSLFTEHPLAPERNPHSLSTEHPLQRERNPHSLSTEHPLQPGRNPHPLFTEHPLQPERNPGLARFPHHSAAPDTKLPQCGNSEPVPAVSLPGSQPTPIHPTAVSLPGSQPTPQHPTAVSPTPILGTTQNLKTLCRTHFIDEIIVCTHHRPTVLDVIADAQESGVGVRVIPDLYDGLAWGARLDYLGHFPTLAVVHRTTPAFAMTLKRAIDILGSASALILLSPVLLLLALIVKLDSPGPILYASKRLGKKGRPFPCYKFRTMVADADLQKAKLQHLNERDGILFKITNDPRITRAGRFLRKHSLDELPQFWNVLIGDMSLVGPRPPLASEVKKYETGYFRRLEVAPGITGLWQVEARNNPSFDKYISLDLHYVENWSLGLDIQILLRTVSVVLAGTGS
jgi:lipopolysaccharide/colanic/teichoic acid biosynthesis glycosyltransferase